VSFPYEVNVLENEKPTGCGWHQRACKFLNLLEYLRTLLRMRR
jgi:hypothetical protein